MEVISATAYQCFDHVYTATENLLTAVTWIKDDPDKMAKFWTLVSHVLNLMADARAELMNIGIMRTVVLVDSVQIFIDIADAFNGTLANANWYVIAQRVAFAFANCAVLVEFLAKLEYITLPLKLTATVVTSVALSAIINVGIAIGYGISSLKAMYQLLTLHNFQHQKEIAIKSTLDVIAYTAATALPVIALVGASLASVELAALGCIALGFGLISFVYEKFHEDELQEIDESRGAKIRHVPVVSSASAMVSVSENFEKMCKFAAKIIKSVPYKAYAAITDFTDSYVEFHGLLYLAKRAKDWINRDETGERFWQKQATTIWRIGDKIFQTALALCYSAIFVIKYKFMELAWIASATIGGLAVLPLGVQLSMMGYSSCRLVDNSKKLVGDLGCNSKAAKSYQKWSLRLNSINNEQTLEFVAVSQRRRAQKNADESVKIKQLNLADYAKKKLEQKEAILANACIQRNKSFINTGIDVTKICGSSLAIVGMALVAIANSPLTLGVTIATGVFGLSNGALALGKISYESAHKKAKPIPSLVAAAAAA